MFFDKALKFDPSNPELLERAIMSEVAQGDLDGASQHAEELIVTAPTARIPHLVIGVRAMRDGGYAKARQEFEKVSGNAAAEIARAAGPCLRAFFRRQFRQGQRSDRQDVGAPTACAPSPTIIWR